MPSEYELQERRRYDRGPSLLSRFFNWLVSKFEGAPRPEPERPDLPSTIPPPSLPRITYIAPEDWERERRRFRNR